ncbi:hypothetical protein [Synechocystis sp. PCC 7509]|uniref:hypothetical protein n=1 Tax=Synechocystis sp. PCC 7509 TaxID=927677 RepID=UPI0002AC2E46|nr:hypothetical protein [Synechocystis sp. PCC 7509]
MTLEQNAEEEEMLTPYEAYEHNGTADHHTDGFSQDQELLDPRLIGWEFKIVRAKRNLFADPAVFQFLCAEEAEAGWILLEKLDDRRVRFKRPIALREIIKAEFLNYDPYRCSYGSSWQPSKWLSAIALLIAVVVPAYLGYTFVAQSLATTTTRSMQSFPPVAPLPKP